MKIGLPREIKPQEDRVGMTPVGVSHLCHKGHKVFVEQGAGIGSGFSDAEYKHAGAHIVKKHEDVYHEAELLVKVKEPLEEEYSLLHKGMLVFAYLHLAANLPLTQALLRAQATGISYDTFRMGNILPLLRPMSEIAGRMAPLVGSYCMAKYNGGTGALITGVPGVLPAKILILGGGVSGYNAARVASGLGAEVAILEKNAERVRWLDENLPNIRVLQANDNIPQSYLENADLIIGSVLIPGAKAPRIITREMLKVMKEGCVLIDLAIDQGGCIETSRPTTHKNPTYVEEGITHYCVANMPGAYAKTATLALTNATYAYITLLADYGLNATCIRQAEFMSAINTYHGHVTCEAVCEAHHLPFKAFKIH